MNILEASKKYEENIIAQIIVNSLPYVGGAMDVLLSKTWADFQTKRANDLLDKIQKEVSEIKTSLINKAFLESEEFYDLIMKIANVSVQTRCSEIRTGCARVVRDAIVESESIVDLENIVRQISELSKHDLTLLTILKRQFDSSTEVTGNIISRLFRDGKCSEVECEIYLYRFETLGLLDHPRNTLTGRGQVRFQKTVLFDKIISYLGL